MKIVSFLAVVVATVALGSIGCAAEQDDVAASEEQTGATSQALEIGADEEPTEQTREHILLARQVGVPSATPQTREHILLARQVGVP